MKSGPESTGVQRAPEPEEFVSRKLIRPSMSETHAASAGNDRLPRPQKTLRPGSDRRPQVAEQTFAENFYFQKQVQSKTLMTILLKNGETVHGTIDWYDKNCVRIYRTAKPNILIYKPGIRYMYKAADEHQR